MQAYSDPARELDQHALPDIEVFYMSYTEFMTADADSWMAELMRDNPAYPINNTAHDTASNLAGFYWWSCFPGCLPDGEPIGPFETEAEALADAQDI